MDALLIAVGAFFAYIIAYFTYGRWLSRRIFKLNPETVTPSKALQDDSDYVPTKKSVLFGHHFTSIAGTGPIVGPAIALFWGWLPALLWAVFGSIFIGAVHDFAVLVISTRNQGQTIGELAGRLISPRAKLLFMLLLFFALMLVIAIFGLVIAKVFTMFPSSVLPVWFSLPVAIAIGVMVYRGNMKLLIPSVVALIILYSMIVVGANWLNISLDSEPLPVAAASQDAADGDAASENPTEQLLKITVGPPVKAADTDADVTAEAETAGPTTWTITTPKWLNPVVVWTIVLLIYCFIASVLPVWMLLQPRDYVNSHQLFLALALLIGGIIFAGLSGQSDLMTSAPAVVSADELPSGAPATFSFLPPIFPFLFITVACGAASGFHGLVSSGTSSKQLRLETDAQMVGYGSMLLESMLAVLVIIACTAGLTLGIGSGDSSVAAASENPPAVVSTDTAAPAAAVAADQKLDPKRVAWRKHYDNTKAWSQFSLGQKVGAFVEGGGNFIHSLGLHRPLAIAIMAVLIASFAATTLDTATRLQRYVVQELAKTCHLKIFCNKYMATAVAVGTGGFIALMPGPTGVAGTGGLILWPLFGTLNQLLVGLALLAVFFYLWRRCLPTWFLSPILVVMLIIPAAALYLQIFDRDQGWYFSGNNLLMTIGLISAGLMIWLLIEGLLIIKKSRGVLEPGAEAETAICGSCAEVDESQDDSSGDLALESIAD